MFFLEVDLTSFLLSLHLFHSDNGVREEHRVFAGRRNDDGSLGNIEDGSGRDWKAFFRWWRVGETLKAKDEMHMVVGE